MTAPSVGWSAASCRQSAALGGHVEAYEDCTHSRIAYDSCRNCHCPKCQRAAREQWLADREAELLPVPYFHVVLIVPTEGKRGLEATLRGCRVAG